MPRIIVKGPQAATSTSSPGSNHSGATCLRLYNTNASDQLISVEDSDETLLGTFTIKTKTVEYLEKSPTHQVFSASSDVVVTPVAING